MSGILLLIGVVSFGILAAYCIPFYIDMYRAMTGQKTTFDGSYFTIFKLIALIIPISLIAAFIYTLCQ